MTRYGFFLFKSEAVSEKITSLYSLALWVFFQISRFQGMTYLLNNKSEKKTQTNRKSDKGVVQKRR